MNFSTNISKPAVFMHLITGALSEGDACHLQHPNFYHFRFSFVILAKAGIQPALRLSDEFPS
ncbi:MAG: hypothetical protein PHV34_12250 [Verrucomicrobiae bacterium]|nr:hypothetical protein [Verrucomicrobiae bacterium]